MDSNHPTRRLAAIMLADVAGYSRMMERDERGTHLRLRELRSQVTDPAIERHHGRIVRSKGDDLLVEFASAVEALSCAVEIQRDMAERNRDLAADSRIEFRIGINLGDILVDGTEIAGDGVNVAARLESLAAPGEVAISAAVREQVRQLVGVQLADAGQHRVKNISRPIRVYKVRLSSTPQRGYLRRLRRLVLRARPVVAVLALALIAAVVALRWAPWNKTEAPRQSLAVAPFSAAEGAAALANELTGDASAALSQMLNGAVAAPGAIAQLRGLAHDPQAIGQRLNVRYLLEGELGEAGDEVRLNARLIGTEGGRQIWAGTIKGRRESGERVPLEVIGRLVNQVAGEIRRAELNRPNPGGPDATELVLRAWTLMPNTETTEQLRDVRRLYEQALQLEPDRVDALSGAAYSLAYESERAATVEAGQPLLQRANELSLKAISLGTQNAEAWRVRAGVLQMMEQWPAAQEAIERALAINPYDSEAYGQYGSILISIGRSEDALAALNKAIRLNPDNETVGVHLNSRCRALLYLGRYRQAIDSCTRGLAYAPDWPDYMLLTAAYAMEGDSRSAAQARAELMRREPHFSIAWIQSKAITLNPSTVEQREKHLIAGLRKAGVQER